MHTHLPRAARTPSSSAAVRPASRRLAWPQGMRDQRLPARPMHAIDRPTLLWQQWLRRSWWRLQRRWQAQGLPRPVWC